MGCGSSSLKGEKVNTVNSEPAEQPIKRVQTNFSDIDFTGDGGGARRGKSFAVAPDEQRRPTRISETVNEDLPELPHHTTVVPEGEKLAPYRTIDGDDNLASPTTETHALHTNVPTTTTATSQDPALVYSSSLQQPNGHENKEERKQTWYARAQSRLSNPNRNNSQISDEDLMRVFGMTRQQWDAYCNDPRNGVGGHAKASDYPIMGGAGATGF